MRTRARVDANHGAIVAALRRVGCNVLDLSRVGAGCPDLLVSCRRRGGLPDLLLMEVKTAKGKFSADQRKFEALGWPVFVARSVEEALKIVGVDIR